MLLLRFVVFAISCAALTCVVHADGDDLTKKEVQVSIATDEKKSEPDAAAAAPAAAAVPERSAVEAETEPKPLDSRYASGQSNDNNNNNDGMNNVKLYRNRGRHSSNNKRRRYYNSNADNKGSRRQKYYTKSSSRQQLENLLKDLHQPDRVIDLGTRDLGTTYTRSSQVKVVKSRNDRYYTRNLRNNVIANLKVLKKKVHTDTKILVRKPLTVDNIRVNQQTRYIKNIYPRLVKVYVHQYGTVVKPAHVAQVTRTASAARRVIRHPLQVTSRLEREQLGTRYEPERDLGVKWSFANVQPAAATYGQQQQQQQNHSDNNNNVVVVIGNNGARPQRRARGYQAYEARSNGNNAALEDRAMKLENGPQRALKLKTRKRAALKPFENF